VQESDVTATLSDLERKLKELERELEAVGRGGEPEPAPQQAPPPPPPPGATPLAASWHGTQQSVPPPPPPPAYNGAPEPVHIQPPAPPWQPVASWQGGAQQPPPPPPPAWSPPPPAPAAAAGAHRQLDELLAFRERLVRSTNDLVAELSRLLTDLGVEASAPPPPPDPAATVLAGHVVVEAGPFADLGTLAAFEQALARTRGVANVHVRALDSGHATIDVDLAEPVALAAELRAVAPAPFGVTDVREGWLVLALAPGGGHAPA
jgi:hypothetical protein